MSFVTRGRIVRGEAVDRARCRSFIAGPSEAQRVRLSREEVERPPERRPHRRMAAHPLGGDRRGRAGGRRDAWRGRRRAAAEAEQARLAAAWSRPARARGEAGRARSRSRRSRSPRCSPSDLIGRALEMDPRAHRVARAEALRRPVAPAASASNATRSTPRPSAPTCPQPASVAPRGRDRRNRKHGACPRLAPRAHRARHPRCPPPPPTRAARRRPPRCPRARLKRARRLRPGPLAAPRPALRWRRSSASFSPALDAGDKWWSRSLSSSSLSARAPLRGLAPRRSSSRTRRGTTSRRAFTRSTRRSRTSSRCPILSPFGTMGAVIRMRGTIRTRAALLDIGAAGPLAGLVLRHPALRSGEPRTPSSSPLDRRRAIS